MYSRVVSKFWGEIELFLEFGGLCMDPFRLICMRAWENGIFVIFLPCTTVHKRYTPVRALSFSYLGFKSCLSVSKNIFTQSLPFIFRGDQPYEGRAASRTINSSLILCFPSKKKHV